LISVGGEFWIENNFNLSDISPLVNLSSVGGYVNINDNFSLLNLTGLNNISHLNNDLRIEDNHNLINLSGLNNLTSIAGSLFILLNDNLTVFSGLDVLTSVGDGFYITANSNLGSLAGLEGLTSIGGDLDITGNSNLISLSGFNNLQTISGAFNVNYNFILPSLSGLDSIAPASIASLSLNNNPLLSTCHIQSVCEYLVDPTGTIEISENAVGCSSQQEVEEACFNDIEDINFKNGFLISPNPCSGTLSLRYTISDKRYMMFDLFEISGVKIKQLLSEEKNPGSYEMEFDLSDLPKGVYFCVLKSSNQLKTRKLIKL